MTTEIFIEITIFLSGLFILAKSSRWAVGKSVKISETFSISRLAIGFMLVAVTTTLPEFFVSILSINAGEVGLAIGNVFGSNISNLALILPIMMLFGLPITSLGKAITLKSKDMKGLSELLFITFLLQLFIFQYDKLDFLIGVILVAVFFLLIFRNYRAGHTIKPEPYVSETYRKIVLFGEYFAAAVLVLLSSHMLVSSSISIAKTFSISTTFIGLTAVAIGTSLPELSVGIQAIRRKEYALAMGDIIGSGLVDLTLILGYISIASPVAVLLAPMAELLPFLLLTTVVVWYAISRYNKLNWKIIIMLLFIYIAFFIGEAGIQLLK